MCSKAVTCYDSSMFDTTDTQSTPPFDYSTKTLISTDTYSRGNFQLSKIQDRENFLPNCAGNFQVQGLLSNKRSSINQRELMDHQSIHQLGVADGTILPECKNIFLSCNLVTKENNYEPQLGISDQTKLQDSLLEEQEIAVSIYLELLDSGKGDKLAGYLLGNQPISQQLSRTGHANFSVRNTSSISGKKLRDFIQSCIRSMQVSEHQASATTTKFVDLPDSQFCQILPKLFSECKPKRKDQKLRMVYNSIFKLIVNEGWEYSRSNLQIRLDSFLSKYPKGDRDELKALFACSKAPSKKRLVNTFTKAPEIAKLFKKIVDDGTYFEDYLMKRQVKTEHIFRVFNRLYTDKAGDIETISHTLSTTFKSFPWSRSEILESCTTLKEIAAKCIPLGTDSILELQPQTPSEPQQKLPVKPQKIAKPTLYRQQTVKFQASRPAKIDQTPSKSLKSEGSSSMVSPRSEGSTSSKTETSIIINTCKNNEHESHPQSIHPTAATYVTYPFQQTIESVFLPPKAGQAARTSSCESLQVAAQQTQGLRQILQQCQPEQPTCHASHNNQSEKQQRVQQIHQHSDKPQEYSNSLQQLQCARLRTALTGEAWDSREGRVYLRHCGCMCLHGCEVGGQWAAKLEVHSCQLGPIEAQSLTLRGPLVGPANLSDPLQEGFPSKLIPVGFARNFCSFVPPKPVQSDRHD
jgi:hypothetical protein